MSSSKSYFDIYAADEYWQEGIMPYPNEPLNEMLMGIVDTPKSAVVEQIGALYTQLSGVQGYVKEESDRVGCIDDASNYLLKIVSEKRIVGSWLERHMSSIRDVETFEGLCNDMDDLDLYGGGPARFVFETEAGKDAVMVRSVHYGRPGRLLRAVRAVRSDTVTAEKPTPVRFPHSLMVGQNYADSSGKRIRKVAAATLLKPVAATPRSTRRRS